MIDPQLCYGKLTPVEPGVDRLSGLLAFHIIFPAYLAYSLPLSRLLHCIFYLFRESFYYSQV